MFNSYPNYVYDGKTIKNYYSSVVFLQSYLSKNLSSFIKHQMAQGDTPEGLSRRYYQTDRYWYLILMVNQIQDPFFEWFLSDEEILQHASLYCEKKEIVDPVEVATVTGEIFNTLSQKFYNTVLVLPKSTIVAQMDSELNRYLATEGK